MADGNLTGWMDLYEVYLDRVEISFRLGRECVRLARVTRDPADAHLFQNLCFATRSHRFAAAQWRQRARCLGLAVLMVINGACTAQHDDDAGSFVAVKQHGVVVWTYTVPKATLDTLHGYGLERGDAINLGISTGNRLAGAIDRHLARLHLCPGNWQFDHAYRSGDAWTFNGHCASREIQG